MTVSADYIVNTYRLRRSAQGLILNRMQELRDHYQGDVIYPLPELDKNEKGFVANLITQGLDQMGMRIASTMPNVNFPDLGDTDLQRKKARQRRMVTLGWWDANRLKIKMRRRARHYLGYSCAPVVICPDFDRSVPQWDTRNPLGAFPAPSRDPDDICPDDAIFAYHRTLGWLVDRYPDQMTVLRKGKDRDNRDAKFEVLHYYDADETVMLVVGGTADPDAYEYAGYRQVATDGSSPWEILERSPNRAGICPVVYPGRITLDRPMGAFDGILGMHDMQAMLMSLEMIAVKRSIFPDEWLVARPNEQPSIVRAANGLTGVVGLAKGGAFQTQNLNPGFQTQPMIDRLEQGQRSGASIPPEFGGESGTNIRTGRRGDAVMSAAVDMAIQEAQEVFQDSLAAENVRAIAISKAYFGSKAMSFYVSAKGGMERADYTPKDLFDTDNTSINFVKYSAPGSDINQLVTTCGQRVGIGEMSVQTFMEIDPLIENPEQELGRIEVEALRKAMLASLQTQAEQGQLPAVDLARIATLVLDKDTSLFAAVDVAHKEAQARQAAQAPPPDAAGGAAPGAMPGLAAPGAGAESQPPPQIGPPPASSSNLQALLSSLHQPSAGPAPAMAG